MRGGDSAAAGARTLLQSAARQLRTANPVDAMGHELDDSLTRPAGDDAYRRRRTLEPRFSETAAGSLAFDLLPGGPLASPAERVSQATETVRRLTAGSFGHSALRWVDGRLEVAQDLGGSSASWGASLGSGFGRDGVVESAVHLEWGPQLLDSLPAPLHRVVQVVVETLPGLRPAFSTVRATHHGGSQQVTFEVPRALPLSRLRPLMERLRLGHQHAGLVSAVALLLGARYTIPPGAGMITVRIGRAGVELRLDVDLDAIPDPPPGITRLIGLSMAERPRSMRAFRRWVAALTPDGYEGPGRLSVLSVLVRPDLPARLALYLRPAVLEEPPRHRHHRHGHHYEDDEAWTPPRDEVPASAWMPAGASP
jgi:hypothetical protein